MIHTDGVHIVSDFDLSELHDFAEYVGIRAHWYHRGRWPHYDVPKRQRPTAKAVLAGYGVRITTTRGLVEAMRNGHILDELIAEDRSRTGLTDAGLRYRGPVTR